MTASPTSARRGGVLSAAIPVAVAFLIFGMVYGAAARPVLGATLAVVSSLIMFSGTAQFTMVALLSAGAPAVGVLGAVSALALRHLPLGAVLRPRLGPGRARRALLGWFLVDETTGLALTVDQPAERVLAVGGATLYPAWVVGTIIGVAGGAVAPAEPLAAALFPVLFVGLVALTATTRWDAVRAFAAGGASLVLLAAWPAAGALGVIGVAIAVAFAVPAS